jgi:arginine deiminase
MSQLGTFSEVGKLREVLVHRPDLSLQRLTPDNCKALLFDDVLWVKKARQEHDVFVDALRERNISVLDAGRMLAETLEIPASSDLAARPARQRNHDGP